MNAPKSPRELFDSFRQYGDELGVKDLVSNWSVADVLPAQVYYSVLGRLPEGAFARRPDGYDAAAHYRNGLGGDEFQHNILSLVLNAYPEKRRLIFVHIPKCAGSHLTETLMAGRPALSFHLAERTWTRPEALFRALKTLSVKLAASDEVFVHGHLPLRWHLQRRLARFGDHLFTTVRAPDRLLISQVNYILTRLSRDPELEAVDTQDWLKHLGRDLWEKAKARGDYADFALAILHSPAVRPNLICHFLGQGTAQSAFELCASASVELADMEHYPDWLKRRWGLEASEPSNVSQPFVKLEDLGAEGASRIGSLTEQDALFCEKLRGLMGEPGRVSVAGWELLR